MTAIMVIMEEITISGAGFALEVLQKESHNERYVCYTLGLDQQVEGKLAVGNTSPKLAIIYWN